MTLFHHTVLALAATLAALAAPGWLGISLADAERPTITEVVPGSPAEKAGLRIGDVITTFDGEKVDSVEALVSRVRARPAGEKVALAIERGDQKLEVEVTLGERPQATEPPPDAPRTDRPAREPAPMPTQEMPGMSPWLGLVLQQGEEDGLTVVEIQEPSPASRVDIRAGDRLLRVGATDVDDFEQLDEALAQLTPGKRTELILLRDDEEQRVELTVGAQPSRGQRLRPVEQPRPAAGELRATVERLRAEQRELRRRLDELTRRIDQLEQRLERTPRDG